MPFHLDIDLLLITGSEFSVWNMKTRSLKNRRKANKKSRYWTLVSFIGLFFGWNVFRKLLSRDWHLVSFITLFAIVLWWTLICGIWSRYAIDIWAFFLGLRRESLLEQHRDLCIVIYLWVLSNKRFFAVTTECRNYYTEAIFDNSNSDR